MTHWSIDYIGKPWENGAHGPDEYDCWGFVRAVYADIYGTPLDPVDVSAHAPLAVRHAMQSASPVRGWVDVDLDALAEGDVITMGQGRYPDHVGIWLAAGGILHCVRGMGVVFQTVQSLNRTGYRMLHAYRRAA